MLRSLPAVANMLPSWQKSRQLISFPGSVSTANTAWKLWNDIFTSEPDNSNKKQHCLLIITIIIVNIINVYKMLQYADSFMVTVSGIDAFYTCIFFRKVNSL